MVEVETYRIGLLWVGIIKDGDLQATTALGFTSWQASARVIAKNEKRWTK